MNRDEIAFIIFKQFFDPKRTDVREAWNEAKPVGFLEAADSILVEIEKHAEGAYDLGWHDGAQYGRDNYA